MNPVVHLEMPYDDQSRMAGFYEQAFGWQNQKLGPEIGNCAVATTTPTGASGPLTPGAMNGGFFPRKPDWSAPYPSVVIAVNDIRAAMQPVPRGTATPD